MKIGLIGFGKMGKEIKKELNKNDNILFILEKNKSIKTPRNIHRFYDTSEIKKEDLQNIDILIEFTSPKDAKKIILDIIKKKEKLKILSGTTSWNINSIKESLKKHKVIFLYESNYSIGINLIFNKILDIAKFLYKNNFDVNIEETHHTSKKDRPSGTAKTISNILKQGRIKHKIKSIRKGNVPGTHEISFKTKNEELEIKHTAKNRKIFANGAVICAKKLLKIKNPGIYNFSDLQ